MTDRTFHVLLVEDNPGDADLVCDMLSEGDGVCFAIHTETTLLAGLDRLAQGDIDAVLLDLTLPDSNGLDTVTTLRAHASSVPIILLTGVNSETIGLQAMQCGAQDYLVKGTFSGPTLTRVLRYAIARQNTQADQLKNATQTKPATVIGVLGAKGGVGATTIACHLALELKEQTGQPVLLADLDLNASSLSLLVKANSSYSMLDAAGRVQHLDLNCWQTMVAQGAGGMDVILSPGPHMIEKHPRIETIRHVLRLVRKYYSWIVVDVSRLSASSLTLASELTSIWLVTTPDVLALYETKSVLKKLSESRIPQDRIRLILNYTHPGHGQFTQKDVEGVVGRPVYLSLPEVYAELCDASMDGRLLSETSGFREQLAKCAAAAAGVERKKPARKFSVPWFGGAAAQSEPTRL